MSIYEQAEKAVASGDQEAVSLWLNSGGHVNDIIGYPEGRTALHIAASTGNEEMVRLLLGYRPDLFAGDENGYSPREVANRAGHKGVAEIIEEAAERKRRTWRGKDAPAREDHLRFWTSHAEQDRLDRQTTRRSK